MHAFETFPRTQTLLHLRYPHLPILMLGERGHPGIVRAKKNDEKVEDYAAFPNLNPVQMAVYCLVLLFFCGRFVCETPYYLVMLVFGLQ